MAVGTGSSKQPRWLPDAPALRLAARLQHRRHRASEGVALQRVPGHLLVAGVQLAAGLAEKISQRLRDRDDEADERDGRSGGRLASGELQE